MISILRVEINPLLADQPVTAITLYLGGVEAMGGGAGPRFYGNSWYEMRHAALAVGRYLGGRVVAADAHLSTTRGALVDPGRLAIFADALVLRQARAIVIVILVRVAHVTRVCFAGLIARRLNHAG